MSDASEPPPAPTGDSAEPGDPAERAPTPPTPPPPWWATLVITFVCGALIGGIVIYATGPWPRRPAPESNPDPGPVVTAQAPAPTAHVDDAPEPPTDVVDPIHESGESGESGIEPRAETGVVAPAPLPDDSPNGLRDRFGAAILRLTGFDNDGDARPPSPAVAIGPRHVLAPFSAIEGATRARLQSERGPSVAIAGLLGFDAAFDLVLLSTDADLPPPHLVFQGSPLDRATEGVLLGLAVEHGWDPAPVKIAPGAMDGFSGGPRLSFERATTFAGAVIDDTGRLLAIEPAAAEPARAVHFAERWARDGTGMPLDRFVQNAGPGSPTSQVRAARKLLAQRRYHEATRLFLRLTAAEPRLLPDVAKELHEAALAAASAHITAGAGPTAVVLLTEVLNRQPNDAELWAARGRAHAVGGEIVAAVKAFIHACGLDARRDDVWRAEARGALIDEVNRLHARGMLDAALALLLDQRAAFPSDGKLRVTAAEFLLDKRSFKSAATLYDEAAVLDTRVASEARAGARRARDLAGGPGAIVIDFPRGAGTVFVDARIDGRVSAKLQIDPTRDLSLVPHSVARGAGYSLASAPRIRFHADPTADEVHVVQLNSVVVSGVPTGHVRAAVIDGQVPGADGVLGASFLDRYRVVEDRELGRMVLHPR